MLESESSALPFGDSPKCFDKGYYILLSDKKQVFFYIVLNSIPEVLFYLIRKVPASGEMADSFSADIDQLGLFFQTLLGSV